MARRLQPDSRARLSVREEGSVATKDRGFASMDRTRQREIASKGGKAAHQRGTAHEWTNEEAREAGRKGGMVSHRRKQERQQGDSMLERADDRGGSGNVRSDTDDTDHDEDHGEGGRSDRPG